VLPASAKNYQSYLKIKGVEGPHQTTGSGGWFDCIAVSYSIKGLERIDKLLAKPEQISTQTFNFKKRPFNFFVVKKTHDRQKELKKLCKARSKISQGQILFITNTGHTVKMELMGLVISAITPRGGADRLVLKVDQVKLALLK
jgi:hypothetical protein